MVVAGGVKLEISAQKNNDKCLHQGVIILELVFIFSFELRSHPLSG